MDVALRMRRLHCTDFIILILSETFGKFSVDQLLSVYFLLMSTCNLAAASFFLTNIGLFKFHSTSRHCSKKCDM